MGGGFVYERCSRLERSTKEKSQSWGNHFFLLSHVRKDQNNERWGILQYGVWCRKVKRRRGSFKRKIREDFIIKVREDYKTKK